MYMYLLHDILYSTGQVQVVKAIYAYQAQHVIYYTCTCICDRCVVHVFLIYYMYMYMYVQCISVVHVMYLWYTMY